MKRLAIVMGMSGMFALASLTSAAETVCSKVVVEASVEAARGELTLADLLARGSCPKMRQAAAQVSLGTVPRSGSIRVLEGRRVRLLLEGLTERWTESGERNLKAARMKIPERIVVRRAEATKSCSEIAAFITSAAPAPGFEGSSGRWQENLDCVAQGIPETAPLELTRTTWNPALQRWEFALRCAQPEDCIPFMVWLRQEKRLTARVADAANGAASRGRFPSELPARATAKPDGSERLVKPGQTAILTWEQAGIRVVLPVTCLDAGGLGEFVRVRLKNAARTLRAEVVGEGSLRASL